MKLRIKALLSLRWNYTRKGVWVWLKGRHRCPECFGTAFATGPRGRPIFCPRCRDIAFQPRGYQRISSEPKQVLAEQERAASGAAT